MVTWGLKNKKEEQKYGILSRQMWFEGLNRYGRFLCIHNGYRCLGSELTHILCKHTHTSWTHTQRGQMGSNKCWLSLSLCLFPGGKTMLSFRYQIRSELLDRKRGWRLRTQQVRDLGNDIGRVYLRWKCMFYTEYFHIWKQFSICEAAFSQLWRLRTIGR